jgi:hypothetical protein
MGIEKCCWVSLNFITLMKNKSCIYVKHISNFYNNICSQNVSFQVYDRLNRIGVCVPYCVALKLIIQLGKTYPKLMAEALRDGKSIRLIGDNLNYYEGVSHETQEKHKHMVHMFTNTALISDHYFMTKPDEPEIPFHLLTVVNLMLSTAEYNIMKRDIIKLFVHEVVKFLPQLSHLKDSVPKTLAGPDSDHFAHKTGVITLPTLPYNEQYYQDDVKILDWKEGLLRQVIQDAGVGDDIKFQIGGDQLTRERFTHALLLRLGNLDPRERFSRLGRCTYEFFHLGMNYMERMLFDELWNKSGLVEVGMLRGECERISRNSVEPNVMKVYDADKRFVINYVHALMVEVAMDFFGMETRNDTPTHHIPPKFTNPQQQKEWVYATFGQIVDEYVYPVWTGNDKPQMVLEGKKLDVMFHLLFHWAICSLVLVFPVNICSTVGFYVTH